MHINFKNKTVSCALQIAAPLFFCVTFVPTLAHAKKTEQGLFLGQAIGGSYNPIGLLWDSRLLYRLPLVPKDGTLWESTKLEVGIHNGWTPADNILAAGVSIEPIAFLSLACEAGSYEMFSGLGYGCYRFASATDPYGPQTQKFLKPTNAHGYRLSVAPTLKAKFGRIIILNTTALNGQAVNGTGYFLEVRSYLLHRTRDFDAVNDAYVLGECSPWLLAGATYHYVYVNGTSFRSQRLSAMAIVKPKVRGLRSTFAALNAGEYLQDPLFNHTCFLGCMVGIDVRLARGSKRKAS
jgi:hypothetical protein